jgi:hypothetical protein
MSWETLYCAMCGRFFHVPGSFYARVNARNYVCERCEDLSALFGHIYALHIVGKQREDVEVLINMLEEHEDASALSYHNVYSSVFGWSGTYWFYDGIKPQLLTLIGSVKSEYRLVDISTGEVALSFQPKAGTRPAGTLSHLLLRISDEGNLPC